MPLAIRISARAAGQVRKAAQWWARHRPAAPGALGADFGEAVKRLAEHPGLGARYEGGRTPGVPRLFLNRVGSFVYYRAGPAELRVLAFWHARRGHQPAL